MLVWLTNRVWLFTEGVRCFTVGEVFGLGLQGSHSVVKLLGGLVITGWCRQSCLVALCRQLLCSVIARCLGFGVGA